MTNTVELERLIRESGIKKCVIAQKLGIVRYTLMKKVRGETEFTASEIKELCRILGIRTEKQKNYIFFYAA